MRKETFKNALITGASSGIGEALALELASRGCHIALSARRVELLEALAEKVRGQGVRAEIYPCDTADQTAVEYAGRQALEAFGSFDLAILNAGMASYVYPKKFNVDEIEQLINVNLMGAIYWIGALLPSMLARKSGTLAAMSSAASCRGLPTVASYSASKAGLSTFFESLRVDLRKHGVRSVVIEPGYVRTPIIEHNPDAPFAMDADKAAKIIVNRLEKGKTVIRFPWQMAVIIRLIRAMPTWLYDKISSSVRN